MTPVSSSAESEGGDVVETNLRPNILAFASGYFASADTSSKTTKDLFMD
jgi:hypothetical protein